MTTLVLPSLPERFTHTQVQAFLLACQQSMAAQAAGCTVWQLPAGALVEFDSSALAVCLSLQRQAQAKGAQLQLLDCPNRLKDLSTLYGVHELLAA
jgi:phospholipid transport system transporter-binding protein